MLRRLALVLVVGCGGAPAPAAPPPAPAAATGSVTSPCVVNASGASKEAEAVRCWIGAECFVKPMTPPSPGDGLVGMTCEGAQCECSRTIAVTQREATEAFTAPRPCESTDVARVLLVEHCLHGTPLLP